MTRRLITTAAIWMAAGAAVIWATVPAAAAKAPPTIELSAATAKPGDQVNVTLKGWDAGVVAVSVCGNQARRGSPDCALRSAQSVNTTSRINPPIAQLIVERPPMPCPCVIRVANTGDDLVQTVPIVLVGVPTAPVVGPDEPGPLLAVHVSVTDSKSSLLERLRASLGGRAQRSLELVVKNNATTVGNRVTVTAAVGRNTTTGQSVTVPAIATVQPGEARVITAPLTLGAPTWGHYVVFGTVAGQGVPVSFVSSTATNPLLLFLLIVILVADLAAMVVLRIRRHRVVPTMATAAVSPVVAARATLIARAVTRVSPGPERRMSGRQTAREQFVLRAPRPGKARNVAAVGAKKATPRSSGRPASPAGHPSGFFQSRKAMAVSAGAVVAVVVVLAVVARSSSTSGSPNPTGGAVTGAQASGGADSGTPTTGGRATGPSTTTRRNPAAAPIGGALPANVDVKGATHAKDGQAVTVHVAADKASLTYGFDARLCAGDAVIRFDADMSPLVAGKCVSKPLSANSDDYVEVQAQAPFSSVDGTFRVGAGTDHFTLRTGQPVTITCGPGHPCQIAVEVQYPNGFAIRTYPVTYG